jgi:hypothetical protein
MTAALAPPQTQKYYYNMPKNRNFVHNSRTNLAHKFISSFLPTSHKFPFDHGIPSQQLLRTQRHIFG